MRRRHFQHHERKLAAVRGVLKATPMTSEMLFRHARPHPAPPQKLYSTCWECLGDWDPPARPPPARVKLEITGKISKLFITFPPDFCVRNPSGWWKLGLGWLFSAGLWGARSSGSVGYWTFLVASFRWGRGERTFLMSSKPTPEAHTARNWQLLIGI